MVQGVIVSIWAAVLTFGGGGNNVSFLTAISLTVVIYLIGYVLFFLAYFVLVLKKKNLERTYQIPGGKIVKLIVAGVGLLMSVAAIVSAFFPPTSLSKSSDMSYEIILAASFIVTILILFFIYGIHLKKKNKVTKEKTIQEKVALSMK